MLFKVEVVTLASDKVNPTNINPLTRMWRVIHASQLLFNVFPKYLKVIEIAMVDVFSFVEDEWCFNFVAFLKNKVRNRLTTIFSYLFLRMHKFFSHFTTFLMKILMKFGLMFNQQMTEADMLLF
jgi:hypothetical protein